MMKSAQKKAITEALKEGGRLVILAIVPVALSGINTETGVISIDFKRVLATGIVTILIVLQRMADKGVHTYNKERAVPRTKGVSMGIIPF